MAIVVVSGLPRSGTSLLMQMLQAAGIALVSDGERQADDDNPAGYWEHEKVKKIKTDQSWLTQADGKAVKVITPLIFELPGSFDYKVIVMNRNMPEILASQKTMMARRGQEGSTMPDAMLTKVFEQQLNKLERWLTAQTNCQHIAVHYSDIMAEPRLQVERIIDLLALPLNADDMIACVRPELYRNRE